MRFQTARHPAAAVAEQNAGQHPRRFAQRRIEPQADMAVIDRHQMLAHAAYRLLARRIRQIGQISQGGAPFLDIVITAAAVAGGNEHLQKTAGVAIECIHVPVGAAEIWPRSKPGRNDRHTGLTNLAVSRKHWLRSRSIARMTQLSANRECRINSLKKAYRVMSNQGSHDYYPKKRRPFAA